MGVLEGEASLTPLIYMELTLLMDLFHPLWAELGAHH